MESLRQEKFIKPADAETKKAARETKLEVVSEKPLSSGMYGDTYDAEVKLGEKIRRFVLKKFRDSSEKRTNDTYSAEEGAELAMQNYLMAKKAGLKVFTTYRISEDKKSILMTNGNLNNYVCIGTSENSPRLSDFGLEDLSYISNAKQLAQELGIQSIKAANAGIILHPDSFLFLVNKATKEDVDFVIGDLDNIQKEGSDKHRLSRANLTNAFIALDWFIRRSIVRDKREVYQAWFMEAEGAIKEQIDSL